MPSKTRKHYQLWTNDKQVIGIMERIRKEYPDLTSDSAVVKQLILWFGEQKWDEFKLRKETTLNARLTQGIETLFSGLDKLHHMIQNGATVQQTTSVVEEMRGGVQKWGAFEDGIESAFEDLDFEDVDE